MDVLPTRRPRRRDMSDIATISRNSNSTRTLLRTAASGDQSAWEALYGRNRAVLHAIVRSRLPRYFRTRLDSEDVLQSAFLTAFHKLPTFVYDGSDSFRAWLTAILVNKLTDKIKYHSRERRAVQRESDDTSHQGLLDEEPDHRHSPSVILAAAESQALVLEAIGRLSETDQELICLRHFDRLSWKEIADQVGISETHARRRGFDAVERLVSRLL
jgi:RNA polymerase sigma-70 factor (ECF subfamily)